MTNAIHRATMQAAKLGGPSPKDLLGLYGTNDFHKCIKWQPEPAVELSGVKMNLLKPKPGEMGGLTVNACFVKGQPGKVVFERLTDGFAKPMPQYSQVFDVDAPRPRGL